MPLSRTLRFDGESMKRRFFPAVVLAAMTLVIPAASGASVLTVTNSGPLAPPSCPTNPCVVISRTTAVQVKDGSDHEPFEIHERGEIVSWSVTLAVPSSGQIHYFDTREGGTSRAALVILRKGTGVTYRLVALSPLVHMQPYFGTTEQIKLSRPIAVTAGEIVALSVPTWLPALALDYPATTSWRASRSTGDCTNVTDQTAQSTLGSAANYDCLYQTALVTYSATEETSR
jgi:hypothetical protein